MNAPELSVLMRGFEAVAGPRAPLYQRLAVGLADQSEVLAILAEAPLPNRMPVTLLAAVHDLLLADPSVPLAAYYPNLTAEPRTDDPVPAFVGFCHDHRDEVAELVRTRTPQTNEIGRCALLLVGLARVAREVGVLAHLDVGASAGLNLLVGELGYDYAGHRLGGQRLVVNCTPRGDRQDLLPTQIPRFSARLGLDRSPIDLADAEQVRWLRACVWPDQTDRFERLGAAIQLAREIGVEVRAGDAVTALASSVAALAAGHPVITTSWVLNYLDQAARDAFVRELAGIALSRDLSWVCAESPSLAPGLPCPPGMADSSLTLLSVVRWRGGRRSVEHLATCHPHGYWLRWLP
ncbi:MAG: DUF2332 domain-containing protein [Propionicimonas sp.]